MTPRSLLGALVAVLLVGAVVVLGILRAAPRATSTASASPSLTSSPAPSDALPPPLDAPSVYARFATLGQATAGGEAGVLAATRAGVLALPSGRIVAADVYFVDAPAFVRQVAPGSYDVTALHIDFGPLDDRIAAALVRFRPGDPVRWEMAVTPGQDVSQVTADGGFFGYSVDSGTGCFTSAEAVAALGATDSEASTAYAKLVESALFPSATNVKSTAEIALPGTAGLDVVAFESGFGDGAYPTWFGLDATGSPVVLLTNFGILDPPTG